MKKYLPGKFSGWVHLSCVFGLILGIFYIFLTGDTPFVSFGFSAGESISGLSMTIVVVFAVYWITQDE